MEHPDKSLEARLFVSVYTKRLQVQKNMPPLTAIQKGMEAWDKSEERAQLMQQYKSRGFGLDDAARARKENGGKDPVLKANIFEMSAEKQKGQR